MDLLPEFKSYCRQQNFFQSGSKILLGVSGGPDSLAMLDLFCRFRKEEQLELAVFHLDHGIREASRAEADFVRSFCQKRDLSCWIERINLPEIQDNTQAGVEELARRIRRAFYYKYARQLNCSILALGHQLNDRVETMLFNLIRGSGIKGLQGITPTGCYRDLKIIRPLLNFYRSSIEMYCRERNLDPRIDRSNLSLEYSRNRIRNELIPYLEEHFNPELKKNLAATAELIAEESGFLDRVTANLYQEMVIRKEEHRLDFNCQEIASLDPVLQKRLLRYIIARLLDSREGFYQQHYELMLEIINEEAETGGKEPARDYDFPRNLLVRLEYGMVSFRDRIWQTLQARNSRFNLTLEGEGRVELPGKSSLLAKVSELPDNWRSLAARENTALIDYNSFTWPLRIRSRQDGDCFYPLGLGGSQKVKDYLINNKIPLDERDRLPIITDSRGRIIWLAGERLDERFRVTPDTDRILWLEYQPNS